MGLLLKKKTIKQKLNWKIINKYNYYKFNLNYN